MFSSVFLALAGAVTLVAAIGLDYRDSVVVNGTTNLTLSVSEISQLVSDSVLDAINHDDYLDYLPENLTVASADFDPMLAQGAPQHFKSYNTTSTDLFIKFIVDGQLPASCPPSFNATNTTAAWIKMTYGMPWRLAADAKNDTNIVAWQLSRPLYDNETLYHATWGTGFMASEAGAMCGYNFPKRVNNALHGPLTGCKDLYIPKASVVRCINVVLRV